MCLEALKIVEGTRMTIWGLFSFTSKRVGIKRFKEVDLFKKRGVVKKGNANVVGVKVCV